jgi:galactokinase
MDQAPPVQQLARSATDEFVRQFGPRPRWLAAAPGQGNLIGEHTDSNDGFVLPTVLDRRRLK